MVYSSYTAKMVKYTIFLLAILMLFGALCCVHGAALEWDSGNIMAGETYIKYCWLDGTPPYSVSLDNGDAITGWMQDCIVSSELEPATLHSIYLVDNTASALYFEQMTDENFFTSDTAYWLYFEIAMLVVSMFIPFFVFVSWFAGLGALIAAIDAGYGWLTMFVVGMLFIGGFMRLIVARRGGV